MEHAKVLGGDEAARVLEKTLGSFKGDLTIADAAAKSGLPLRDAEVGLHALVTKYRGHLRATSDGEIIFRFPRGLTRPWITKGGIERVADRVGRALVGVGRFVVRAWIMIVLVGYTLAFLAIVIAAVFSNRGGGRRSSSSGFGAFILFRILADAIFWTFHPFSPFAYANAGAWNAVPARAVRKPAGPKEPFYEKVNRFFFGPTRPAPDPFETEKKLLAEIRAQKGRIGLADVMRITGLPREEADPLMSKILVDFDGTVAVAEGGGIVYKFESIRKTVGEADGGRGVAPVWAKRKRLPPLTGNDGGANLLILALNTFNLLMSLFAIRMDLTLHHISQMIAAVPEQRMVYDGTPIVFGVVPLAFSVALFALPIARAALRPFKAKRVAQENGRRAMLKAILTRLQKGGVSDEEVKSAFREAAGRDVDDKDLNREIAKLGGDVEISDEGRVKYRFPDLEAEAEALEAEREAAAAEEADVGKVVFSSDA